VETIQNSLRLPGQYYDAETGLHYNWHRYYDSKLGRYVRTDPIGFEGSDVNWYRYAQENPVSLVDPLGLTDYSEIPENLIYSCKCGWIDWTHASPGILNQMWNNSWALAEYQKNMFAPLEQFSIGPHGELILHNFGILADSPTFTQDNQQIQLTININMSQEMKIKGVGLPYTIIGPYCSEYEISPECLDLWFLQDSAPQLASTTFSEWQPPGDVLSTAYQRQASIALGIWMHLQENFERNFQGGQREHWWSPDPPYQLVPGVGSSSFSEEDLASDWLAFYMNIYKYSKEDIMSEEICDAVGEEESQYIYRQLYGKDFLLWKKRPGTSHVWKPVNHNDVAPSCCDSGEPYLEWPEKLNTIQPGYYDCWQSLGEIKGWPRLERN
jgi:RHS repeat-associated protein